MNSKEYWEKRQLAREEKSFNKGTEAYEEYVKILNESRKEINNRIAQLYAKYQNEVGKLGVDKIRADKLLHGTEYKEWRYDIGKYVREIRKLKKTNPIEFRKLSIELEALAFKSRISRLDNLKASIDYELIQAGAKIKDKVTDTLTEIYKDTYTSLVKDLDFKKGVISSDVIKKALEHEWSGSNYSGRIWSNTDNLARAIKNEVIIGLNKGINYRTMSQNTAKKFDTGYKNAERLVRTETNHIQNQATLMGYKDAGVTKYEFLAVLDSRTSHTCASLSGEVFKTENAMEGENYPPMHPNCRSTTVPYEYGDPVNAKEEDLKNDEHEGIFAKSQLGKNTIDVLEKEFGKLNGHEVILRNERVEHIKVRHPEVKDYIKETFEKAISEPDIMLSDYKNKNTALIIKNISEKNFVLVIKLSVANIDKKDIQNSIITAYKMREVKRLQKKNKVLFDKSQK